MSRRIRRLGVACLLLVVTAVVSSCASHESQALSSSTAGSATAASSAAASTIDGGVPGTVWPGYGQAAIQVGLAQVQAGPNQHPAPIASVAKVMTAYLVLRAHPLLLGQDGPSITLTDADVADTDDRRRQDESFVPVAGTVHNTDTMLGHNGFVGIKTGSDRAAGGCFAFRAVRWIDGKQTTITGVVLGQPGENEVAAGLAAADAMVENAIGIRAEKP